MKRRKIGKRTRLKSRMSRYNNIGGGRHPNVILTRAFRPSEDSDTLQIGVGWYLQDRNGTKYFEKPWKHRIKTRVGQRFLAGRNRS